MLKRKLTAEGTVPELAAIDLWSLATNGTQEGRSLSLSKGIYQIPYFNLPDSRNL